MLARPTTRPARERRQMFRRHVLLIANISCGEENVDCCVLNFSETGALLRLVTPFDFSGTARLSIPANIMRPPREFSCRLVWRDGERLGVRYSKD